MNHGSILCSDKWPAYKDLQKNLKIEDCDLTVNHSENLVDSTQGLSKEYGDT